MPPSIASSNSDLATLVVYLGQSFAFGMCRVAGNREVTAVCVKSVAMETVSSARFIIRSLIFCLLRLKNAAAFSLKIIDECMKRHGHTHRSNYSFLLLLLSSLNKSHTRRINYIQLNSSNVLKTSGKRVIFKGK